MKEYIALDCHKRYTLVEREEIKTGKGRLKVERGQTFKNHLIRHSNIIGINAKSVGVRV